jgi:hypothetical protein
MLRNEGSSAETFSKKFKALKEKLGELEKIPLDQGYYKELEHYLDRLYHETVEADSFDDERLSEIRELEMSNLNRLQKMKNASSYKKEKHRQKEEIWE